MKKRLQQCYLWLYFAWRRWPHQYSFSSIAGGGVEQSFIYPIYAGIIVLAGLIVGAVDIIVNEIRELKKQWKRNESRKRNRKFGSFLVIT